MAANPTMKLFLIIDDDLFKQGYINSYTILKNAKFKNEFFEVPSIPDIVLIKVQHRTEWNGSKTFWKDKPVCYFIIDKVHAPQLSNWTWGQNNRGYGYNGKDKIGLHDLVLWNNLTRAKSKIKED